MALPIILVGAAVAAAGFGAKKGYDGYKDKSIANSIIRVSEKNYNQAKESLDHTNSETSLALDELGQIELQIGTEFRDFSTIAKELLQKIECSEGESLTLNIPSHQLDRIDRLSISAIEYLGTIVGAGTTGAAAGFAVYSGVMAFAAASTGTPITALSGVAAYNATMAAIGGGSLAAGGWGMAGGAMVLGGAVIAPILAVGGWFYAKHAEKALSQAAKVQSEVQDAVNKMDVAKAKLISTKDYANKIYNSLANIYQHFSHYHGELKKINDFINNIKEKGLSLELELQKQSTNIITTIQNGYALAAILTDIITTPLFKLKKNDQAEACLTENIAIEMETDEEGFQILNEEGLDAALIKATNDFNAQSKET